MVNNVPEYREAAMRALDAQVELATWVRDNPQAETFHQSWNKDRNVTSDGLRSVQFRTLDAAQTFAVTGDIYEFIEFGASTLPEDFTLQLPDVIVPSGFVWFDEPQHRHDRQGRQTTFRALAWSLCFSRDGRSYALPQAVPSLHEDGSVVVPTGIQIWLYTDPFVDDWDHLHEKIRAERHRFPPIMLLNYGLLDFDETLEGRDSGVEGWLCAFFRFVMEPWVDDRAIVADRATRRRTARAGFEQEEIRVVRLRKPLERRHHQPTGEPVDWQHRWLVRGHWRKQPVKDGYEYRFIRPYVKGPDDKPFLPKDRIFSVDR